MGTSRFSPGDDGRAGLVAFLVALPLCLGIALASGAPLVSGLVTGVVGGTVTALLSGSHTAVSGPAAGLAVIVLGGIAELGSFERFLAAVVVCGLLQVLFGALRGGVVATLFPASVVRGMLAAIGVILVLKQIPHALGHDADFEGDESFWFAAGRENTFTEIAAAIYTATPGVILVSLLGLALLIAWDKPAIRRLPWVGRAPGPLVVVIAGVAVNQILRGFAPGYAILGSEGHLVAVPDLLAGGVRLPVLDVSAFLDVRTWTVGLELAVIASLETLLSTEAGDRLDPQRRTTPPDRELMAQGVGNVLCGLVGGLPMTAVIVRSSASIQAGSRSRWAAVIHGLLLGALALAVPGVLNQIPLGSLAAVLMYLGYKLASPAVFADMYRRGASQYYPFLITVVTTVVTDLLIGVCVGFIAGICAIVIGGARRGIAVVRRDGDCLVKFTRDITFVHKYALRNVLLAVPKDVEVTIDAYDAGYLDPDILDVLARFVERRQEIGRGVVLIGFEGRALQLSSDH